MRCGRYGRSSTGRPLRRAAAAAEPASRRRLSRSPCTRVHSTRWPNRPPPPRNSDSGGCRAAARSSRRVSSSTSASSTSPRKASVRCHCCGRVHLNSGASSRSAAVIALSASVTSSGGVSATNNRTQSSWQRQATASWVGRHISERGTDRLGANYQVRGSRAVCCRPAYPLTASRAALPSRTKPVRPVGAGGPPPDAAAAAPTPLKGEVLVVLIPSAAACSRG